VLAAMVSALSPSWGRAQPAVREWPDPGYRRLGVYGSGPDSYFDYQLVADLEAVLAEPLNEVQSRRDAWWNGWWDKSSLQLTSENPMAKRLCGAYHVHLYTLGCTNRGPLPCKWDGGPGLMRRDERTWGLSEWVQEIRFTYMPLYAANRQEMAKGLTDHYTRMRPYLQPATLPVKGSQTGRKREIIASGVTNSLEYCRLKSEFIREVLK